MVILEQPSNYIWRGMTQTKDKSSVNGGADLKYNGLYVGTWASNVDFGTQANFENRWIYWL